MLKGTDKQEILRMKKKNNKNRKITIEDYIKAVKKADREIQIENSTGWSATTKVHKSKKIYDRKRARDSYNEEY